MCLNYADGMANSLDPDQTAAQEQSVVWSGSTLLSED